jgi:hypothetical protein
MLTADLHTLTHMNITDLHRSFKVADRPLLRHLVTLIGWLPARRLAMSMAACDALAGSAGLAAAGQVIVKDYAGALDIVDSEHFPTHGPLLICANHPGMVDASALFTAIPRNDVRVLAADRPLLRALPNIAARLICVPDDARGRALAMRQAIQHVRQGGALLTFPAGRIEPDPALMADAASTLPSWSDFTALLCRTIPDLPVVGVLISGVISGRALRNRWVQRINERKDREWTAATLQLIVPWYKAPLVRIRCAPAIVSPNTAHIQLIQTMAALIASEQAARQSCLLAPTSGVIHD